jgi:hypothetical protein
MLLNRKADLAYPLYPASLHLIERIALRRKSIPGFCPICGHFTKMIEWGSNLRETGLCENCHSINRHRQIAYVLCASLNEWHGAIYHSINSNKKLSAYPSIILRQPARSTIIFPGTKGMYAVNISAKNMRLVSL